MACIPIDMHAAPFHVGNHVSRILLFRSELEQTRVRMVADIKAIFYFDVRNPVEGDDGLTEHFVYNNGITIYLHIKEQLVAKKHCRDSEKDSADDPKYHFHGKVIEQEISEHGKPGADDQHHGEEDHQALDGICT